MPERRRILYELSEDDYRELASIAVKSRISFARLSSMAVREFLQRNRGQTLLAGKGHAD